jgi:hypothetical protein
MARFAASEHQLESGDGTTLFYRAWRPCAPTWESDRSRVVTTINAELAAS